MRGVAIAAVAAALGLGTVVTTEATAAVAAELSAEQWRTTEITLTASGEYDDPLADVTVDAVFTSPSGTVITRPAFWDGGHIWRVRFAPTEVGSWSMVTVASVAGDNGLNGATATIETAPYSGDLEIYQRGFLRSSADGRYFEYADGTPFFYLGDTHWIMPHERFDTSNAPGVESQFKYTVDKRADQGFTVYQSEPIWQPHSEGVSQHDGADEEEVANLTDGFDENDLAGFANLDRKFAYIADAGLVHANAEVTWAKDPAAFPDTFTDEFMAEMGRYWVARFGSYPVIWTIAQEIDRNMYGAYTPEMMSKWYSVGEAIAENDDYHQVIMPHMENNGTAVASTSSWKDKPWHDAFGAQMQSWSVDSAEDFWNSRPVKPVVAYEAQYEDFWTDARGALNSGYKAFQLGMYGYGYGVAGVWNDVYSAPGETPDFGTDYELPARYQWWFDGVNRDTADQLTILRDFYTAREWWKYEPRFDDADWATLPTETYLSSDADDHFVALFTDANSAVSNGTINHLDPAATYDAAWFDARTGDTRSIGEVRGSLRGVWEVPAKPSAEDWILTLDKSSTSMPEGGIDAAIVSASSSHQRHPASDAVDGDLATAWRSSARPAEGEWLQLQFDGVKSFNTVIAGVSGLTDTRAAVSARVEYWKDGGWTAVGELPGSPGGETLGTVQFSTVTSDRVRLSFGTDAKKPEVSEFAVFDAPPKTVGNLAEDGVYSASSSLDANQVAANAFDGDEGTNWQACGNCWQDQWLEVDFGGEVQFDSVTISEYDNRTSAYRIEYWAAGKWRTAYQGSKPFGDRIAMTIDFAPVIGSKVRILYLAGTGYAPVVYEFGVYNSGVSLLPVGDLAVGGLFTASSQ